MTHLPSSLGNLNLAVAAGLCSIYRGHDAVHVRTQDWPLGDTQDHDRDGVVG
jgi:hypothetical protein